MERKAAYANLAKWFEYLNDDCGYENWSQYLILTLKKYPLTAGLDVGCGGGWFTRAFQRAGYQMTGMDISAEMLTKSDFMNIRKMLSKQFPEIMILINSTIWLSAPVLAAEKQKASFCP